MRKQLRPAPPDEFRQHSDKWNSQWADLRTRNPAASFSWYAVGNRSSREIALPVLREMNQGHCSFCDVFPLDDRSSEPIEHFKPKTRPEFHREAFSWDNLFYCCEFCQKTKRERWDTEFPPLRPDDPEYLFHRYFRFVYSTGAIEPNPLLKASSPDEWERARVTIDFYGLDKPARNRRRLQALRMWSKASGRILDDHPYRDFLEGGALLDP